MTRRKVSRFTLLLVLAGWPSLMAKPASAAPTSAACIGQFFSSHAGLGAAHTGETVGSMTSGAARELKGGDFGATISGTRTLPRGDCGL